MDSTKAWASTLWMVFALANEGCLPGNLPRRGTTDAMTPSQVRFEETYSTVLYKSTKVEYYAKLHTMCIHYMSHHAALREYKKTALLPVVFGAYSHKGHPSLNDCPLTETTWTQTPLQIPCWFVWDSEGLPSRPTSKSLFYQSPYQKRPEAPGDSYGSVAPQRENRQTCVVFGASSSPFLPLITIRKHRKRYETVK